MTIKKKFILLYIFYCLFSVVLIFSFYQLIIKNFVETVEKKIVSDDVVKLKKYLESEFEALLGLTKDWAAWTDAWLYMQNKNHSFADVNITNESLENNKIVLLAYYDLNGQLKEGKELDPKSQKIVSVKTKIWEIYVKYYISLTNKQYIKNKGLVGITFIDKIPYIVAVFEVLKSDFTGPPTGYLIMGRVVSEEKLYFIRKLFNLEHIKFEKSDNNIVFFDIKDYSNKYLITTSEKDFFGNDAVIIKMEKKKFVWAVIKDSVLNMIFIIILLFIIFGIILYLWTSETITKRILFITKRLQRNGETPKLYHKDEIDLLYTTIENYLSHIEQNRKIYESIAEESEAIILIYDEQGNTIFANSTAKQTLSAETGDLFRLYQLLREILEIKQWQKTKLHEFKLKENLFINGWIIPVGEEKNYLLFIAQDITYLVKEKLRLLDKASFDTLTYLYNRGFFENQLKKILKTPEPENYSLIFIDLDDLKKINDTHGHVFGDMAIKAVSDAIRNSIRKEDIAARWGGDEFAVVVKGNEEIAKKLADRIKTNIKSIKINETEEITPSISYGIASIEKDKDIESILKKADELAYKQKISKKN